IQLPCRRSAGLRAAAHRLCHPAHHQCAAGLAGALRRSERLMHATTAPRSTAEIALIALAFVLAGLLLFVPLALIFTFALREGLGVYIANILEPTTLHAVGITVLAAVIVVPVNMAIGVCIAWLV